MAHYLSFSRPARAAGVMPQRQILAARVTDFGIGVLYGVAYSDMCAFRLISRDRSGASSCRK
jgi:hypothetical protein